MCVEMPKAAYLGTDGGRCFHQMVKVTTIQLFICTQQSVGFFFFLQSIFFFPLASLHHLPWLVLHLHPPTSSFISQVSYSLLSSFWNLFHQLSCINLSFQEQKVLVTEAEDVKSLHSSIIFSWNDPQFKPINKLEPLSVYLCLHKNTVSIHRYKSSWKNTKAYEVSVLIQL